MKVDLDEVRRREAFLMLVGLQDDGAKVEESRDNVAAYYSIPVTDVIGIEQEGIEKAWPPLDGGV